VERRSKLFANPSSPLILYQSVEIGYDGFQPIIRDIFALRKLHVWWKRQMWRREESFQELEGFFLLNSN
jgi:hypothetical protein